MATKLEKALKREVQIGEQPYMLTIDPQGLKLVPKGKRNGLELAWSALASAASPPISEFQVSSRPFRFPLGTSLSPCGSMVSM